MPQHLGVFYLPAGVHRELAMHLTAEYRESKFVKGKGLKFHWVQQRGSNHLLDCTYLACAGGHDALGGKDANGKFDYGRIMSNGFLRVECVCNETGIRPSLRHADIDFRHARVVEGVFGF